MTVLTKSQADQLCVFIEKQIANIGCDHSLKNTFVWADKNDLMDVLECNGGFFDYEVTMNLPENCDLELVKENGEEDLRNTIKNPLNKSLESVLEKINSSKPCN